MDVPKIKRLWATHPDDRAFCYTPVEWLDLRNRLRRQTVIKELVLSQYSRTHALIFTPGSPTDPASLASERVAFSELTPLDPEVVDPAVMAWFSELRDAEKQRRELAERRALVTEGLEQIKDREGSIPMPGEDGKVEMVPVKEIREGLEGVLTQVDALVDAITQRGAPQYASWVDCWTNGAHSVQQTINVADWGFSLGG